MITNFKNNKIKQTKEKVKFKLIRSVESMIERKPDFLLYKCKKCGSSLSLLNGGTCSYCKNKIQLEDYDWKVIEYNSSWRK